MKKEKLITVVVRISKEKKEEITKAAATPKNKYK